MRRSLIYPGAAVLVLTAGTCPGATDSVVTLAHVIIVPASASLTSGQQQQFVAYGRLSNGDSSAVTVAYAATGGSVSGSGLYTAGSTPGAYQVVATQDGGTLADTAAITIATSATLVRVILSPDSVSLDTGATKQFSVVGKYSDSSTASIAVGYSATGGAISGSGLYTAGHTAGTFRVIATQSGGSLADTSKVVIQAPPPPTLVRVILSPDSVTLDTAATKQFSVVGKYSDSSTAAVAVNYSATGGTISAGGLYTAGKTPGTFRVIATQSGGSLADTSKVVIQAPPPPTLVRVILSPDTVT
ncbi:MAG TPA: hypothetical protein VMH88_14220, partial [Gemmatimonadales bacterium]|nr:hypothetical protein [Gemmatimonadales bacterium]